MLAVLQAILKVLRDIRDELKQFRYLYAEEHGYTIVERPQEETSDEPQAPL